MFNITSHQKSANQNNNEKKRLIIPSVDKDVEQLEFSHVADKNAKISTSTLCNRMALCDNVQHTFITQLSNFTPMYLPKRNECLYLHKHMDMNIQHYS